MSTKIVMLSGKQGSGKTTTADALRVWAGKAIWCFAAVKFATPLYSMHDAISGVAAHFGIPMAKKDGKLLQWLGTEWGRKNFGEDVWVNATKKHIKVIQETKRISPCLIVIDDCRFPNEFEAFPNAHRVRLVAPRDIRKTRTDSWRDDEDHPSETSLDSYEGRFDAIYNTAFVSTSTIVEAITKEITR